MKPLPLTEIAKLEKLMAAMIVEGNLSERSSVEHCKLKLLEGYGRQNMDAYVDNVESPTYCIVFGRMYGIATKEKQNVLLWVFALKEARTTETREALKVAVEGYGNQHPCDAWIASDWTYLGANTGMKSFLTYLGFVPQETVYCKLVKR